MPVPVREAVCRVVEHSQTWIQILGLGELGMAEHAYDPSTGEVEIGGSLV
jgi:hypothetical protein